MIRVVLVGHAADDWKTYRQPQWMAEVRRTPEATRLPRHHFDIEEEAYRLALGSWDHEQAGASFEAANGLLNRHGGVEIGGP